MEYRKYNFKSDKEIIKEYKKKIVEKTNNKRFDYFLKNIVKKYNLNKEQEIRFRKEIFRLWIEEIESKNNFSCDINKIYLPTWFKIIKYKEDMIFGKALELHLKDVENNAEGCYTKPIIRHLDKARKIYEEEIKSYG